MTGQYYQQPEADSTKSLIRIAGIVSIVFGIISFVTGIGYMFWFDTLGIAGIAGLGLMVGVISFISGLLNLAIFFGCRSINKIIDAGKYQQAKSKTLIWMIIGIIFGGMIPGIILLIAYLKFDDLINPSRGYGYMPPPPGYGAPPAPMRLCLNCGQEISSKFNNCPHCGAQVKK